MWRLITVRLTTAANLQDKDSQENSCDCLAALNEYVFCWEESGYDGSLNGKDHQHNTDTPSSSGIFLTHREITYPQELNLFNG